MMGLLQALAQGTDTTLCLFALRVLTSTPPEVALDKAPTFTPEGDQVKTESQQQPITNGESLK